MSPSDERERITDRDVDDGRDRTHERDLQHDDPTLDPDRDRIADSERWDDDGGGVGPEGYSETTRLPSLSRLRGMEVRTTDGEKVGKVKDVYLDAEARYVRYIAVKTGWFSGTHVVPVDDVTYVEEDGDTYLVAPYTQDQLKSAPTFDENDELTPEREREIYDHYQRVGYWDDRRDIVRTRQTEPAPTPQIAEAEVADEIRRGRDPNRVRVKRWGV
jgi:sporulation protein YlmC with PRC-barrel domain